MSSSPPVHPVLRILVAFSHDDGALDWAQARAERDWGTVTHVSPRFAFTETEYYADTMGLDLRLAIMAVGGLVDAGGLADWKRETGRWEAEFAAASGCAGGKPPVARPLNLDPGYLTLGKFILATTKDHAHRIYLRDDIFAEVTLYYSGGGWQPHPWTYPNYRRDDYRAFLLTCRQHLQRLRKEMGG